MLLALWDNGDISLFHQSEASEEERQAGCVKQIKRH